MARALDALLVHARRAARALPGRSLVGAFERDTTLALAFAALSLTAILPLMVTPLLPSPDLPGNVASASLLFHTALGDGIAPDYYRVVWQPFPYWLSYLYLGGATLLFGPLAAAKLLVGTLVVGLPLSVMRLCLALGRDPRVAVWAFLLSWEHNLVQGWHAYGLGMLIALVVIARALEARDDRAALRVAPWVVALVLTHAMPLAFCGLSVALAMLLDRAVRSARRLALMFAPAGALVVLPWLSQRAGAFSADHGARLTFDYPSVGHKASSLFAYTLDNVPGTFGQSTTALSFALLLLGPLVLSKVAGEREGRDGARLTALAAPLAALVLYAALPMSVTGPVDHWYTYPRYASYFLASWLLVPRPRLDRRGLLALAPGVALSVASHAAVALRYHAFAERASPFVHILAATPPNVRLLPLEYVRDDPSVSFASLAHVHSYLTAGKVLFDPHLFDNPSTPIQYRRDMSVRRISWLGPRDFTLERYAPFYDYILVQGLEADPLPAHPEVPGFRARLVVEAGIWRLYAVERT